MVTISPHDHVCPTTGCHNHAGTGAHGPHDSIDVVDTLVAEVADVRSEVPLDVPDHSTMVIVESTMPGSVAHLVAMHGCRTFFVVDTQATPFPANTPLLDCPAAIIACAPNLTLPMTGHPWHVPHRMGTSIAPTVSSTISPHTRIACSSLQAHRWISTPPDVIQSFQHKLETLTRVLLAAALAAAGQMH